MPLRAGRRHRDASHRLHRFGQPIEDLNGAFRPLNAALIIGLALGVGLPARVLSTRVATGLGQASYSMYILHIPLLWWYKLLWLHQSGYLTQTASALVYLVCVVILSAAVTRLVEAPANRRIRKWVGAHGIPRADSPSGICGAGWQPAPLETRTPRSSPARRARATGATARPACPDAAHSRHRTALSPARRALRRTGR